MPEIQTHGPAAKLRALFDLVGSSPAPFLSPEIVPVVLLNDLSEGSVGLSLLDLAAQVDERFYIANVSSGGTPAVRSRCSLINPVGSGVLCVPKRFVMSSGGASPPLEVRVSEPDVVALPIGRAGISLDGRFPAPGACGMRQDTTAGVGTGDKFVTVGLQPDPTDFFDFIAGTYLLTEGFMITWTQGPVNIGLVVGVEWSELQLSG